MLALHCFVVRIKLLDTTMKTEMYALDCVSVYVMPFCGRNYEIMFLIKICLIYIIWLLYNWDDL